MNSQPKFRGILFVPTIETVFKLVSPLETTIQYNGYAKNMYFTEDCMEALGLKVIKSSGMPYPTYGKPQVMGFSAVTTIFLIPPGSMFKIKMGKKWNQTRRRYDRNPMLLFTTKLNKGGPIKGGIQVKDVINMPEVEEM